MQQFVPERLQRLRKEKGFTQKALGMQLGISDRAVSKWETGASVPELDKLIRMKEIFGVTLETLVGGENSTSVSEVAQKPPQTAVIKEILPLRKIIGALCFCLAFTASAIKSAIF